MNGNYDIDQYKNSEELLLVYSGMTKKGTQV